MRDFGAALCQTEAGRERGIGCLWPGVVRRRPALSSRKVPLRIKLELTRSQRPSTTVAQCSLASRAPPMGAACQVYLVKELAGLTGQLFLFVGA